MNIGKKAALLTAAAGAMVVVGSTAASANPYIDGPYSVQSNACDTASGSISNTAIVGPTGDMTIGSDCINFTNSGAVAQSNDCDTATGAILNDSITGPTGDTTIGSNCANIAVDDTH